MHTASLELKVSACELSAFVILLSAYAHVTLSRYGNVLKIGNDKRKVNIQSYSRHTTEDSCLGYSREVRCATCCLRCRTVVAYRVAKTTNTHYAVSNLYG